ncbi:hypothetical protein ABK040_004646 [Willaertia magna]
MITDNENMLVENETMSREREEAVGHLIYGDSLITLKLGEPDNEMTKLELDKTYYFVKIPENTPPATLFIPNKNTSIKITKKLNELLSILKLQCMELDKNIVDKRVVKSSLLKTIKLLILQIREFNDDIEGVEAIKKLLFGYLDTDVSESCLILNDTTFKSLFDNYLKVIISNNTLESFNEFYNNTYEQSSLDSSSALALFFYTT